MLDIIAVIIEVPELLKRQYWREIFIFFFLLFFTTLVAYLYVKGFEIPNPMDGLKYIVKDLLKLNYK
jgi:hypothetical protein